MPSDIFISYAREDRARVQPIAEALAQRGFGVWWDKGLHSGDDYRDRIEEMLQTARCVVVAWSRDSVQSDFVLDEAGRGHHRKVLLPVFIDEGIEPPLGFGGIHTTDLSGWLAGRDDAALEQFVGDVQNRLGRVAPAAPAGVPDPRPRPASRARRGRGFAAVVSLLVIVVVGFALTRLPAGTPAKADVVGAVAPASRAGTSVLDGAFRLAARNGQPVPVQYPGSLGSLVSASLELREAAGAARDGSGLWWQQYTTRAPGGSDKTITWEAQFRLAGETMYVSTPGGDLRYHYAVSGDGGLTLTDLSTTEVWTYVRQ
jgi:hypothetical protein